MYAIKLKNLGFASAGGGGGGAVDAVIKANTDWFRPPSEEEIRERDLAHEAGIALSVATLLLVGADVLWAMLGLAFLGDFQWAILAFLAADVGLAWVSRSPSFRNRALAVARGVAGVAWFTAAAILFGESVAFPVGQGILLLAVVLLVVGRGGEGKIATGIVVAVISVALTFSLAFAQKQTELNDRNQGIGQVFELASVGRVGDAVDAMELLLEQYPDDAWVHMAAAELFSSDLIRDLNRAVVLADRAVQLASSELKSRAYIVLAVVHEMRGEFGKAIENVSNAIEADDKNPLAYWIRGRLFAITERRVEAIEDWRKVEELAPDTDLAQGARLARLQMQGDRPVRVTAPGN